MPKVRVNSQLEETSPLVTQLLGSAKGSTTWDETDPDKLVRITYTVYAVDIQEVNPGVYYNISSVVTAKEGDTAFSDDGRLFVYDEPGSRWFLWYTFDEGSLQLVTNSTLTGSGTVGDPLSVNMAMIASKGQLNPLLTGVDNGDGTYTFTSVDGSTMFTIGSQGSSGVQSVNGNTGVVTLDADDLDDTSTTNKFVTAAEKSDIASAVQPGDLATVATTGAYLDLTGTPAIPNSLDDLSGNSDDISEGTTNLFMTSLERSKLTGIASGAEVNVNSDWNAGSGDAEILNKPTLGTASAADVGDFATSAQGAKADTAIQPSDIDTLAELNNIITDANLDDESNPRPPTAHTHTASEITNFDTEVSNNVDVSQNTTDRHTHTNKAALDNIDNTGAGNLFLSDDGTYKGVSSGSAEWGTITGTLSSQTDLQNELDGKSDVGHQHTASDITDFDTEVGNNADVAANTNARHTHSNKTLLDTYNQTNADITQAISDASTAVQPGDLATVATTGSYSDLTGAPAIPDSLDDLSGDSDDITEGTAQLFMTTTERNKLSGIDSGAEVNVNADWNAVSGDAQILNKPTLGTAAAADTGDFATSAQGSLANTAVQPGDNVSDLTNDSGFVDSAGAASAAPVQSVNSQTGSVVLDADDVDDSTTVNKFVTAAEKSDIASAIQPGDLATVATTGAYSDLTGTPTLGTAAAADTGDFATAAQGALADTATQPGDLATVATTGAYSDLTGTPTLGTAATADIGDFATSAQGSLADSAVQSVTGVGVDNTDPKNPVLTVSASGIQSVVGGVGIDVDNTDPDNPEVSLIDETIQLKDYFKRVYIATPDGDHTDRTNKIVISNHNAGASTFETNIDPSLLQEMDFNPTPSGKSWVGHLNLNENPNFLVTNYDNGVFTYTISGISGTPLAPSNGSTLELHNPFVNYSNIRSDDGFLIPTIYNGATFDGKTISYVSGYTYHKKRDGTHVLIISLEFTTSTAGQSSYLAFSTDLVNWTMQTPVWLENSLLPSPVTGGFSVIGIYPYGENFMIFGNTVHPEGRKPMVGICDDDLNILVDFKVVNIPGFDFSVYNMQSIRSTYFDGQLRIMWWNIKVAGNINRPTYETILTGSLTEIYNGEATAEVNLVHTPTAGVGIDYGHIDAWEYLILGGSLHAVYGFTDLDTSDGSFLTYQNRQFGLASLVDGVWVKDAGNPYITNPVRWDDIDSRYDWQWDHTGSYPDIVNIDGTLYMFSSNNQGTDTYNLILMKLVNTPGNKRIQSTIDKEYVDSLGVDASSVSGLKISDFITNITDDFLSENKIRNIVTLTEAELTGLTIPDVNTLYIVPEISTAYIATVVDTGEYYLSLDGVDDKIYAQNNTVFDVTTGDFDMEITFRTTNTLVYSGLMTKRQGGAATGYQLYQSTNDTYLDTLVRDSESDLAGGAGSPMGNAAFPNDGEWHTAQLTWDNSFGRLTLFQDEVQVAQHSNTSLIGGSLSNSDVFTVGSRDTTPHWFAGDIFSFRFGTETFDLNEGSGTTVTGSEGTILNIDGATWNANIETNLIPIFDYSTPVDYDTIVRNTEDTYVSIDKATQIVTLTQAEFDLIVTPTAGTLYYIVEP